jgi:hypothetical protein
MVPEGCQDFFEKVPARFQKGFSRTPGVLDSSQEYQQQVPRRRASSLSVRPASPLPERTQHIKQSQKALKRSKKKKAETIRTKTKRHKSFPTCCQDGSRRFQPEFQKGSGKVPADSNMVPARFREGPKIVPRRFQQGSGKDAFSWHHSPAPEIETQHYLCWEYLPKDRRTYEAVARFPLAKIFRSF